MEAAAPVAGAPEDGVLPEPLLGSAIAAPAAAPVAASFESDGLTTSVSVDFVVVFSGDSPAPLLAELRPDIHCKGTDYGSPERVPEYETVRSYGGRTALVGDPKDHATSDLIARVKALPD